MDGSIIFHLTVFSLLNPSIEFLWENTYRAQQYEELFIGSDPTELALHRHIPVEPFLGIATKGKSYRLEAIPLKEFPLVVSSPWENMPLQLNSYFPSSIPF